MVAASLALVEALELTADDRFAGILPVHFGASLIEVIVPPRVGLPLVLVPGEDVMLPQALERVLSEEGMTASLMVPSLVRMVMGASPNEDPFPTLRVLVLAGEEFPSPQVRELMRRSQHVALFNLYAGTETMIRSIYRIDAPPGEHERLPLGTPLANTELIVLGEGGTPAAPGEEGELYVRGSMVSPGYWGDPEKTHAAFVPYPFQPELGARMYRTGDRVRIRPDGVLEHAGRADDQVKSRGVRIELGEIDATASGHPSVAEACAVAVPHETWGSMIVLCVVPRNGAEIDGADLKRFLGGKLPVPMVPAEIHVLPELPRGSTGKIDRRRLTELVSASSRHLD
jgi:acyl-coenzyme A synthetase/AMP-(fatty) acid ligase